MVLLLGICSCSNTRYLKDGQVLHNKNTVKLSSVENIRKEADLQRDLEQQTAPRLNKKALNLFKVRLFAHNFLEGEKGPDRWIRENFAEPPVLFDTLSCERTVKRIKSRLVSKGYFNHNVSYDYTVEEKRASVVYNVELDNRYYIKDIILPTEEHEVAQVVKEKWEKGKQTKFKAFDEDRLAEEKARLTSELRNMGYFDFRQEYIKFRVDSFSKYKLLNLHVDVDSLAGTEGHKKYFIDDIYIISDFNVEGSKGINGDTIVVRGVHGVDGVDGTYNYISTENRFRPKSLTRLVKMKKGKPYSEQDYRLTINQFLELGVFRFVNIRFDKVGGDKLVAYIMLTPSDRNLISYELDAHTRGRGTVLNSNAGNALKFSWKNNNTFGRGELMQLDLPIALEYYLDGKRETQVLTAIDFSPEISFKFPDLLVPFRYDKSLSGNRPITTFNFAFQRVKQVNRYESAEIEFAFGYDWRPSPKWQIIWRPFDIQYFSFWDPTPEFDVERDANPRLKRIFTNSSIIGGLASIDYNNQNLKRPGDFIFARLNLESAGLTLRALETALNRDVNIFGLPYSQFVRIEGDIRRYWQINRNVLIVGRLNAGAGWAYGNSDFNPYSRQFFAGGSSNLRAYLIRGLGPGTSPNDPEDPFGFERFGDYKFTGNLEMRFPIITIFKGAFFTDVGNIWIRRSDDNLVKPGEYVSLDRAAQELAIGAGFGLRVDFGYFVFRLDTAVPIRGTSYDNPTLHKFDWIYDEVWKNFTDKDWRGQNLRFNLGIGYPF